MGININESKCHFLRTYKFLANLLLTSAVVFILTRQTRGSNSQPMFPSLSDHLRGQDKTRNKH